MYNAMKKLIEKQFYNIEEAQNRLDVFYACGRLNEDEYKELCSLIKEAYEE